MKKLKLLFFSLLGSVLFNAQIGIGNGTVTPDPSAILDIQSTSKGLLAPRMTTAQRLAIANPAESLLVYDINLEAFYNYNLSTTSWVEVGSTGAMKRLTYKLVKSKADLKAEIQGEKYVLNTNTLYEINGTVVLDKSIDLNNAYIQGLDSGDDKLLFPGGTIFSGATGGSIKGLTLTGGQIFNLTGNASQNLIFRDCIVVGSTDSVGTISNFGMVFSSIVQYAGNTSGITYNNINQLLLSNIGWFGNNRGTFETLTGTFGLVQKQGGFSDVGSTATFAFDVSGNPTISGSAVLESVVFTGDPTGAKYVKKYSSGSYTGYNFNNNWTVDSPGIPREGDGNATGTIYKENTASFVPTQAENKNTGYKVNTKTTTTNPQTSTLPTNLFRFTAAEGRLTYVGQKPRTFSVNATVSYEANTATTNTDYHFYFVKITGSTVTPLSETTTYTDTKTNSVISTIPVSGTVTLAKNDSVELWLKRLSDGNPQIEVVSYNLSIK